MLTFTPHHCPASPTKTDPDTETDEDCAINIQQKGLRHHHPGHSHSKLKSSLCRNYARNGSCPYGEKCQFAHGPLELRINQNANTSYKTKPCFSFLKQGHCPYGETCNFRHAAPRTMQAGMKWKIVSNFPEMIWVFGGA